MGPGCRQRQKRHQTGLQVWLCPRQPSRESGVRRSWCELRVTPAPFHPPPPLLPSAHTRSNTLVPSPVSSSLPPSSDGSPPSRASAGHSPSTPKLSPVWTVLRSASTQSPISGVIPECLTGHQGCWCGLALELSSPEQFRVGLGGFFCCCLNPASPWAGCILRPRMGVGFVSPDLPSCELRGLSTR